MTRTIRAALCLALALAALPAAPATAQPAPAWPEALRGTWALGECGAPAVLLQVNARGIARLPETGEQRYTRLGRFTRAGDWVVGHGEGTDAPRLMLRAAGDAIELAAPNPKLLDSELPGAGTPVAQFRRCTSVGGPATTLHGEGLVFAAAVDALEAACGGDAGTSDGCIAALMAHADVSRDGKLSNAELARLVRGAVWFVLASEGASLEILTAGVGIAAAAGLAVGYVVVASYDYDGDGRLSPAEMIQDRGPWPGGAPPPAASLAGRTLPGLTGPALGGGLGGGQPGMLRDLMEGLRPYLDGLARP